MRLCRYPIVKSYHRIIIMWLFLANAAFVKAKQELSYKVETKNVFCDLRFCVSRINRQGAVNSV